MPHPECFHNGIILIVYVIQKSFAKIHKIFEMYKYLRDFLRFICICRKFFVPLQKIRQYDIFAYYIVYHIYRMVTFVSL
jgi:hypothetical protein